MENKVSVFLFVIPVLTSSLEKRYIYRLSDMAYGEWIILEDNKPRYYLYILDDIYKDVREYIHKKNIYVDDLLEQSFRDKNLSLSLRETFKVSKIWESQETSEEFKLEKLPPNLFKID